MDQSSPIFFVKHGSDGGQSSLFSVVDLLIRSGNMATKVYSFPKLRAQSILGGSTAASVTFLLVDQSSPFFGPTRKGWQSIKFVSNCWCLDPFQIYSRQNSKVVQNRRAQSILRRLTSAYNFLISAQKFTIFLFNAAVIAFNEVCYFWYIDRFLRYSRSTLKVITNRAEFWTFLAFPNFKGRCPPNVVFK